MIRSSTRTKSISVPPFLHRITSAIRSGTLRSIVFSASASSGASMASVPGGVSALLFCNLNKSTTPKLSLVLPISLNSLSNLRSLSSSLRYSYRVRASSGLVEGDTLPEAGTGPESAEILGCTNDPVLPPSFSTGKPAFFKNAQDMVERLAKNGTSLELPVKLSSMESRTLLCAASIGFAMVLMGLDDNSRALALGPEGPLVEEFWDNVRRYGLYALTVSTGAIYTILQPIVELLKNPLSALFLILIIGGSGYLIYQVLTAMVGISDFSYDYAS